MSQQLPHVRQRLVDPSGTTTQPFYAWMRRVEDSLAAVTETSEDAWLPATTTVRAGSGIAVSGTLAGGGVTVDLFADTDLVPEGGNLYFTDERAQDATAAMFAAGTHTGISFTYDDTTNAMSASVTGGVFNRIDAAGDIRVDAEGNLRITS